MSSSRMMECEWRCWSTGILLIVLSTVFHSCDAQDFGYNGDKGPNHWGEQYNTCYGKHQSPININSLTVKQRNLPPLKLRGFDLLPNQTTITNNGHTAMVTIEADPRPSITGGPLNGVYEFNQLHFHWGDNDTMGSEDRIDGQSFPMELHMVFYKKQYRNIRSAMDEQDGLAVLAFFYHVAVEDNPNYVEFTELLMNISDAETSISFQQTKSIHELLLSDLADYYTYNGSLTTPPCSEVVTWIDFKHSIPLSHSQIDVFRSIRDDDGNQLTHNFRPIQPLGDRVVFYVPPYSAAVPDLELDENIPAITEPSQDIDLNAPVKHDKFQGDLEEETPEDIDRDMEKIDQNLNSVEKDTTNHPKNTKKGKNSSSIISISNVALIMNTLIWISLNVVR